MLENSSARPAQPASGPAEPGADATGTAAAEAAPTGTAATGSADDRSSGRGRRGGVPWGSVLRNVALVVAVLAMIWLALNVRLPSLDELRAEFAELGAWGPLAFIGLYAVVALTPIPVTIMAVAGGMLFGLPFGTVLSMIGVVLGCWGGYWIARGLGRETVMKGLGSHADMVEDQLENGGFYAVCTLRLMPGIPYWPVNYGSGALGITSRDFLIATALSALPGQISLIAIGSFLANPDIGHGIAVVSSWIIVIVLTLLSYRRWRATRAAEG
ncbi:TVP38/TMEM64 family protein [Brachybacterium tyrofermentans]|uniref:TVP38/TMEM64 family protein n=1 Tax=Brachybacterium tyrofermentans TaxID=47848 RepID=UPI003FD2404D